MEKKTWTPKAVLLRNSLELIPNVFQLEKVGAGHDGYLFRYGDKVIKVLKYDISTRKQKKLMTFEKAIYFQNELRLKRITQPIDIVLDTDGMYNGYVMNYLEDITLEQKKTTPLYRNPGDFTCGELIHSGRELEEDFEQLTNKGIVARDINRGSYIFTTDFMHLCDMDKYQQESRVVADTNRHAFQYMLAKFIGSEMKKVEPCDPNREKQISSWIKHASNSNGFLKELDREVSGNYRSPIKEYVQYKVKTIAHKR